MSKNSITINTKDFERIKNKIIDVTKNEDTLTAYAVFKYLVQFFEKEIPILAEGKVEVKKKVENK
jgi:hypothetical protein